MKTLDRITAELRKSRITDRLIYTLALSLFLLVVLSFFKLPGYEKGAWIGLFAFSNALTGALSFKFGVTIPGAPYGGGGDTADAAETITCPKCGHKFDVREG